MKHFLTLSIEALSCSLCSYSCGDFTKKRVDRLSCLKERHETTESVQPCPAIGYQKSGYTRLIRVRCDRLFRETAGTSRHPSLDTLSSALQAHRCPSFRRRRSFCQLSLSREHRLACWHFVLFVSHRPLLVSPSFIYRHLTQTVSVGLSNTPCPPLLLIARLVAAPLCCDLSSVDEAFSILVSPPFAPGGHRIVLEHGLGVESSRKSSPASVASSTATWCHHAYLHAASQSLLIQCGHEAAVRQDIIPSHPVLNQSPSQRDDGFAFGSEDDGHAHLYRYDHTSINYGQ